MKKHNNIKIIIILISLLSLLIKVAPVIAASISLEESFSGSGSASYYPYPTTAPNDGCTISNATISGKANAQITINAQVIDSISCEKKEPTKVEEFSCGTIEECGSTPACYNPPQYDYSIKQTDNTKTNILAGKGPQQAYYIEGQSQKSILERQGKVSGGYYTTYGPGIDLRVTGQALGGGIINSVGITAGVGDFLGEWKDQGGSGAQQCLEIHGGTGSLILGTQNNSVIGQNVFSASWATAFGTDSPPENAGAIDAGNGDNTTIQKVIQPYVFLIGDCIPPTQISDYSCGTPFYYIDEEPSANKETVGTRSSVQIEKVWPTKEDYTCGIPYTIKFVSAEDYTKEIPSTLGPRSIECDSSATHDELEGMLWDCPKSTIPTVDTIDTITPWYDNTCNYQVIAFEPYYVSDSATCNQDLLSWAKTLKIGWRKVTCTPNFKPTNRTLYSCTISANPNEGNEGQNFTFTTQTTKTTINDGIQTNETITPESIEWIFSDGTTQTTTTPTINHVFKIGNQKLTGTQYTSAKVKIGENYAYCNTSVNIRDNLKAICYGTPQIQTMGKTRNENGVEVNGAKVVWTAIASGGNGNYTYYWKDGELEQQITKIYTTSGQKEQTVTVTDTSTMNSITATCNVIINPFILYCEADKTIASLNEPITYNATIIPSQTTPLNFQWYFDGTLDNTTTSSTKTKTYSTIGKHNAKVSVNYAGNNYEAQCPEVEIKTDATAPECTLTPTQAIVGPGMSTQINAQFINTTTDPVQTANADCGDGANITWIQQCQNNQECSFTCSNYTSNGTVTLNATTQSGRQLQCSTNITYNPTLTLGELKCEFGVPIKNDRIKLARFPLNIENADIPYSLTVDYDSPNNDTQTLSNLYDITQNLTKNYDPNDSKTNYNVVATVTDNLGRTATCETSVSFSPIQNCDKICTNNVLACSRIYYEKTCNTPGYYCCDLKTPQPTKSGVKDKQFVKVALNLSKKSYKIGEDVGVEGEIIFERFENIQNPETIPYMIEIYKPGKMSTYKENGTVVFPANISKVIVKTIKCTGELCIPEPHKLEFKQGIIKEGTYEMVVAITKKYDEEKITSDNADKQNFMVYKVKTAEAPEIHLILIILTTLIVIGIINKKHLLT
ncbi:MAG: hypothetical protein QXU92_04030 [Candidatus Diapherotrites archaeon]